ncbi:hypothetical protein [Psychrobacter sp. I-STPA6b]|uniref:hypothetical protein n=1 Tax=Psychrobacter sp. I-STPA6b TaxID=2585718 RepID=UPI001D0CC5BE|nr:hypothetical protein [Psychrobacter sp. I-STPA6b]
MSTYPTIPDNKPKTTRYAKQHYNYHSIVFLLTMLYLQKDTTQFLFMALLNKLQHGTWWAWLLLIIYGWHIGAKGYWQLSADRLSYYFGHVRLKSMPLTHTPPPSIEIEPNKDGTQYVCIYQHRDDMFVSGYQVLKFHISTGECHYLPQLIEDLRQRIPNIDIKGKFDCTPDITQIKYYDKKLKWAVRVNQLLVVLLLLSIFAKQMVHINYQSWGLLVFVLLSSIAATAVKKSYKNTPLEQLKTMTISLWYSLTPALLFLLMTNIVMLINEYQVTQEQLPTTTITATLESQNISFNYQHWDSEQLPLMPKYFTVYSQHLNFSLQKKQSYPVTLYQGYLGDYVISPVSLAQTNVVQTSLMQTKTE